MKIVCSKGELLQGVQTVQTAVSTKSTLPILSNFLLDVEKTAIKLTATDLEVGIHTLINGQIIKAGNITIPARKFAEIIRELPEEKVEIQSDDSSQITITCGKSHFLVNGLPKEDYPLLPEFQEEKAFQIDKITLEKMFKRTTFAASTDETRYVLNGVFFLVAKEKTTMVATDGRRLAYISAKSSTLSDSEASAKNKLSSPVKSQVIIPTKAVNQLIRLLSETKEEVVKVSIAENQVGFKIKDTVLISRLIEGNFPNYEQVVPKAHKVQLKLKTKEFLQVTKRISLLVSEKAGSVKYNLERGTMKVSSVSPGLGSAEEEITTEYNGESLEIAFNPAYVLDALKAVDAEEVYFELTAPLNPTVIRPVGEEESFCVLMPMRIE